MISWQELLAILTLSSLRHVMTCPVHEEIVGNVIDCLWSTVDQSSLTDVEEMRRHCHYGGFLKVSNCVDTLYQNCTSPNDRKLLTKFADRNHLNSTFKNFCDNFEVYRTKSHCIVRQETALEKCHVNPSSNGSNINEMCGYFITLRRCGSNAVKQSCGEDIATVIWDFIGGITPPLCAYLEHNTPSSSFHLSCNCFVLIASCTLVLTKLFALLYF